MPDLDLIAPFLESHHHELAQEIASFAEERIASLPFPADDEAGRRQAREIVELLGEGGLAGFAIPSEFGGRFENLDLRAACLARETLAHYSPLADDVYALQCLGTMPITLAGSSEQKRRHLPEVATGRSMAAFAMTEPDAGSDVAAISTRATRDGDGWVLDGEKSFISNAGIADVYTVFAATDPEAGSRGLSAFIVEAETPGLVFAEAQVLSAPHPLGRIEFRQCRVPASALLGEEGGGFKLGMRSLDRLRVTVAAAACGMAGRALEEALEHARGRKQFGRPLARFQLIQQKLARMTTELSAARLLTYRAAREADLGAKGVTLASAMAKLHATETAQAVVDDAVQILGGRGLLSTHPVDRLYRAVRALRIYEGTSEIQHLVIAREVLGR